MCPIRGSTLFKLTTVTLFCSQSSVYLYQHHIPCTNPKMLVTYRICTSHLYTHTMLGTTTYCFPSVVIVMVSMCLCSGLCLYFVSPPPLGNFHFTILCENHRVRISWCAVHIQYILCVEKCVSHPRYRKYLAPRQSVQSAGGWCLYINECGCVCVYLPTHSNAVDM